MGKIPYNSTKLPGAAYSSLFESETVWVLPAFTQEIALTQIPSLKDSRNQVTKSKTLQATGENQAEGQAVQEPVMGWRHMVKAPSLCSRCQSGTALVSIWILALFIHEEAQTEVCLSCRTTPVFSVVDMWDLLLYLWVVCSRNRMMQFVLFPKLPFPSLLFVL